MFEESEKKKVDEIVRLENENRILKLKLSRFNFYGSTDCKTENCVMGVTVFTANDYCIRCDPKNYEEIK